MLSSFRAAGRGRPRRPCSRTAVATCLATLTGLLVALAVPQPALAAPAPRNPGPAVEAYAPYQGQSTCAPTARDGVKAFRDLILASYPGSGDLGIVRSCSVGAASEHKEGRAWDWKVAKADPAQNAMAQDLLAWLMAPDQYGNAAAMARRLGVMYVIRDSRIWKSYQASKGWQPYSGSSPHTDHVHLSFSWAGAYGRTSFWTGTVAPTMYAPGAVPPPPSGPATATVTVTTVDRRTQVGWRRTAVESLPGPWKRH